MKPKTFHSKSIPLTTIPLNKKCKEFLSPMNPKQGLLNSLPPFQYNRKTYQDFISKCEDLHKNISEVSVSIGQTLTTSKLIKHCIERKNFIRNKDYLKISKEIDDRAKLKKLEGLPKNLKKIKRVLTNYSTFDVENILEDGELADKNAIEYLGGNKRRFGRMLEEVSDLKPKVNYKLKSVDIKINCDEAEWESLKHSEYKNSKKLNGRANSYETFIIPERNLTIKRNSHKGFFNQLPKKSDPLTKISDFELNLIKTESSKFISSRKTFQKRPSHKQS